MLEKLAGTKVSLQKVEGPQRFRGALGPLLCAAALGTWLNAGAAYALDVPPDAALKEDVELLPVTLNPPGSNLVFGADENCISPVQSPADAAANVQMDATVPDSWTQAEPEEYPLEATTRGACISAAMPFAAAGEPVFVAHAAGTHFGFSATLGQLAMMAGVPAAITKVATAVARKKASRHAAIVALRGGPKALPPGGGLGGPGAGGPTRPPTPTPEPASTLLLVAGAALVGRAVSRRARP